MSLILQTYRHQIYVFLCQWKMCFVCEASSRNIIYSVPKPMKKYFIPRMIIRTIEKCFPRSFDTNAYLIDEQDESFEFQSNIDQKSKAQ